MTYTFHCLHVKSEYGKENRNHGHISFLRFLTPPWLSHFLRGMKAFLILCLHTAPSLPKDNLRYAHAGKPHRTDKTVMPFSRYDGSAVSSLQGDLVYVNYGRTEDFFQLKRQMGINVTGKIVIVRYGKIFRGNKV